MDADQKKLADYLSLVETETINSLGGISRGFLADEEFEEKFMRLAMSRISSAFKRVVDSMLLDELLGNPNVPAGQFAEAQPNCSVIPSVVQVELLGQQEQHSEGNGTMLPDNFDQGLLGSSFYLREDGTLFDLTSILNNCNRIDGVNAPKIKPPMNGPIVSQQKVIAASGDEQTDGSLQRDEDDVKPMNAQMKTVSHAGAPNATDTKPNSNQTNVFGKEVAKIDDKSDDVIVIGDDINADDENGAIAQKSTMISSDKKCDSENDSNVENAKDGKKTDSLARRDSVVDLTADTEFEPEPSTSTQSMKRSNGGAFAKTIQQLKRKHSDENGSGGESSKKRKIEDESASMRRREDDKFHCALCEYKTAKKSHMTYHVRVHPGEKPFKCGSCAMTFTLKQHLSQHERVHEKDFDFPCAVCRRRFKSENARQSHQKSCTRRHFECNICKLATMYKTALVRHLRIHTNEKLFQCSNCSQRFNRKDSLTRHTKSCHM